LTLKVGTITEPICITDKSAFTIGGLALRSSFFFSCSFFLLSDFFSDLDSLLEPSDFVSPPELSDDELDDEDSPEEEEDWEEDEDEDEVEEDVEDTEVPDVDAAAVEAALELAADAADEAAWEAALLAAWAACCATVATIAIGHGVEKMSLTHLVTVPDAKSAYVKILDLFLISTSTPG
jgi:hypothetical protein